MKRNKTMALVLAGVMAASALAGCGSKGVTAETSKAGTSGKTEESSAAGEKTVDLEVWYTNTGFLEVKKDGPLYNFYKDMFGVGIVSPYVEWNGGTTYQEQLNLKIAAGEAPDMFMPVNGMEADLVKNGALLDLTDLLPEKAPHLWETVPKEVWDVIRSYDPSGQGRIYMIPSVFDYPLMSAIIRQDWLDKLNLSMPETQEDFLNVLRAFKTQDPNGNGLADEIPTGGRQEARWMDYLFAMYGISMWEGFPQWDIYNGELTYSAVTPNMKDALLFIRDLYKEGLIDPETLLNDKAGWEGKINSDKVGIYYHWAQATYEYATSLESATGVRAEWAVMPPISAPGYEGFYTEKKIKGIQWVLKNTDDQEKIDAAMKVLDAYGNKDLWQKFFLGVEGEHSKMVDGKLMKLPEDKKTMENLVLQPGKDISTIDSITQLLESVKTDETTWSIDQSIANVQKMPNYGKLIAGDGMPNSVYEGYADIMNRTLYVEYASKIITGEYPIEKFDEFVQKWNASGGEAVTKAAREWYEKTQK
ncbi:MAG: ABC transporter substrate-binding protein [Lachnospiraceae bacterium]|nr:ABC transporter substrate-binding protein [Lachnospiraceae bacterium]